MGAAESHDSIFDDLSCCGRGDAGHTRLLIRPRDHEGLEEKRSNPDVATHSRREPQENPRSRSAVDKKEAEELFREELDPTVLTETLYTIQGAKPCVIIRLTQPSSFARAVQNQVLTERIVGSENQRRALAQPYDAAEQQAPESSIPSIVHAVVCGTDTDCVTGPSIEDDVRTFDEHSRTDEASPAHSRSFCARRIGIDCLQWKGSSNPSNDELPAAQGLDGTVQLFPAFFQV
eukprot:3763262-Rhodomonas_salina.7